MKRAVKLMPGAMALLSFALLNDSTAINKNMTRGDLKSKYPRAFCAAKTKIRDNTPLNFSSGVV